MEQALTTAPEDLKTAEIRQKILAAQQELEHKLAKCSEEQKLVLKAVRERARLHHINQARVHIQSFSSHV
ncbi:MAG: hypothetical protein KIH62_003940 [Candidatus Kerfeldbacteria bacterium]|nr:hypothetical protein [Candidatus Kerfeldbacteria bacterium]